jgi:predicted phage terminase large subunit-like protein
MATDRELFSIVFFPHYCEIAFNQFHRDIFAAFKFGQRSYRRVRAAPRGSAKSTLTTLIFPIHDVCYGLERFILIISNTGPLAAQKLKDIRAEILANDDLVRLYRIRFATKKPGETQFLLQCGSSKTFFMALGRGSQVRGVRFGPWRPTKIVCDDVEFSEEVNNEQIRGKTENWFFEDVGKVGNEKTNIEFVGTVLHPQALLSKLLKNPAYDGQIYRAVVSWSEREDLWQKWREIYTDLENANRQVESQTFYDEHEREMLKGTKVLWPEKEPYLYLMKELVEIGRRAFMKEKQNAPLGADEPGFETIHWYRARHDGIVLEQNDAFIPWKDLKNSAYGVIDPSTGKKKAKGGKLGDYACLLAAYQAPSGRVLVHEDWTRRKGPTKQIEEIFNFHERYNFVKFGVEINLYRELMMNNIVAERSRREAEGGSLIKIPFYEIEQTENKTERIFRLEPRVAHGWMVFNRALSEDFKQMLENFPHAEHDDGPDAAEMIYGLIHKRYEASAVSLNPMGGV